MKLNLLAFAAMAAVAEAVNQRPVRGNRHLGGKKEGDKGGKGGGKKGGGKKGSRILRADLSGLEEVPPIMTDVTGTAEFEVNKYMSMIEFFTSVYVPSPVGLLGVAGAHLHCAPAGQNGPVVAFLAGELFGGLVGEVTFGGTLTDDNISDATTGCGTNIAELYESMLSGNVYVNVHSVANPPGEVRGQIV